MNIAFLGIGTNLGNRLENIDRAKILITEKIGRIIPASTIYETEPWGFNSSLQFLNLVVRVETDLEAEALLEEILSIEKSMGRVRNKMQFESRIIDIDILLFNHDVIDTISLKIPHPLIPERRFVLEPLCELAAEQIHPELNRSIKSLLDVCDDKSKVRVYDE